MGNRSLWQKIRGRYQRNAARYLFRRPLAIKSKYPLVSFTFDDFPRSALRTGGAILQRNGLAATYYASLGLMGKESDTGTMFVPEDLELLLQQGHELGSHTYGHCDAWETNPREFQRSILKNQDALRQLVPTARFRTLSYPVSQPRVDTKRRAGNLYVCCRGGGQTFNVGTADLSCALAFFLEQSRDCPQAVRETIEQNREARGWLIFATHDVSDSPTPWGVTPAFFAQVLDWVIASGARIVPVAEAIGELRSAALG